MHVSDDQLYALLARDPSNPELLEELRSRTRQSLLRRLPNPTGRCPHGYRIMWDQRGVYSSGYPIHMTEEGRTLPGYCDSRDIVNDPPSPARKRLLGALGRLS